MSGLGGAIMRSETLKELKDYQIHATDGDIGKLADLFVDETTWLIRYLVVKTGGLLNRHKVLISPEIATVHDLADGKIIRLGATKDQIERSPEVDTDPPVSRQEEINLGNYYGWDSYWAAPMPPGELPYPEMGRPEHSYLRRHVPEEWLAIMERHRESFNPHLYSLDEIRGYKIGTRDDRTFGECSDAIINTEAWKIEDFILRSRKWLAGGKEFICSPSFVEKIDTDDGVIGVMFDKDVLIGCPDYRPEDYGEHMRIATIRHLVEASSGPIVRERSDEAADHL